VGQAAPIVLRRANDVLQIVSEAAAGEVRQQAWRIVISREVETHLRHCSGCFTSQQGVAQGIVAGSVGAGQASGDTRVDGIAAISGSIAEQATQELRPQQIGQEAAQTHLRPGTDTAKDTSGSDSIIELFVCCQAPP